MCMCMCRYGEFASGNQAKANIDFSEVSVTILTCTYGYICICIHDAIHTCYHTGHTHDSDTQARSETYIYIYIDIIIAQVHA